MENLEKLKAKAYDLIAVIQQLQVQLNEINKQIAEEQKNAENYNV